MQMKASTIEEYFSILKGVQLERANLLRNLLSPILKDTTLDIRYGIPTYRKKKHIIHFGVYHRHTGLYPGSAAVVHFAERLKDFDTSKGTIRFPHNRELPLELITDIAKYCLARYQ